MDEACSTDGETATVYVRSENYNVRDHLGDLGVNERIILKWILEKYRLESSNSG